MISGNRVYIVVAEFSVTTLAVELLLVGEVGGLAATR